MEGYVEICGTPIEVKAIKEFRVVKREYIYRPVYDEIQKKNILGTTTKYLFRSMEPYAAILGQSNGGFLWQKKKYECVNAAGRELYIELEDVPVLVHQADGHSSEVFREDPNYALLGKEKTPNIEYVDTLLIKAKEEYAFYGNDIHLFSVIEAYNKVKEAVEEFRNPKKHEKSEKPNQQEKKSLKEETENESKQNQSSKADLGVVVSRHDSDQQREQEDTDIKQEKEPVKEEKTEEKTVRRDELPIITAEVNTLDEEKNTSKGMDYQCLVGELGDEAFSFLMDSLYPLFNYRVLKKDDVRRIDLMEILVRTEDPTKEDWKDKKGLTYYLFCLKQYMDEYLKCQEGSRAELFKNRAYDILEKDLKEDAEISEDELLSDAEDVFIVFISLFREAGENLDNIDDFVITDVDFNLKKDDAKLLKKIWEHEDLIPDKINDQGGFLWFGKSDEIGKRGVKLTYYNNMIMLCRNMERRGFFS